MRLVNERSLFRQRAMACVLGLLVGCSAHEIAPPPPRDVEVVRLQPSEVRETGEYLGALISRQSVVVMPQVAGYVRQVHVRPGQQVEAGQPLLDVDAREAAAALRSARAEETSTRVDLDLARRTHTRAEALYREGLASAQELEAAAAMVDAAEAAIRGASAQVSQRNVAVDYTVVRAPFAGTVGDVLVRVGDLVSPTTRLTGISQGDLLEVSVAVPSERARTLALDTPLEVLDARGRVLLTSPVFYVAPEADPNTQLVEVKAAFRNTAGLRPSEIVRARLVYSTRMALELPALAVVRQSGQPVALVVQDEDGQTVIERRPVTLGALGATAYVVEAGLNAGDRVAVSSLQVLRDGALVTVKQESQTQADPGRAPTGGSL